MIQTAIDILKHAEANDTGSGFTFADCSRLSYRQGVAMARRRASALRREGVRPGDRVALLLPDPKEFIPTFLACLAAGAVPVPLLAPTSARQAGSALARLTQALEATTPVLVISTGARRSVTGRSPRWVTLDVFNQPAVEAAWGDVSLDQVAFYQFTATGKPTGVTHQALCQQVLALQERWSLARADVGLCWLPPGQPLGLIGGALLSLTTGMSMSWPGSAVGEPSGWLEDASRRRATVVLSIPQMLSAVVEQSKDYHTCGWDLSSVRLLACGGSLLTPEVWRRFSGRLLPCGLHPQAITPFYSVAENVLAVTAGRPDVPVRTAGATEATGCGRPLPGVLIQIRDPSGWPLSDGETGEVWIRSRSLGWFRTHDIGFVEAGELYVTGRFRIELPSSVAARRLPALA